MDSSSAECCTGILGMGVEDGEGRGIPRPRGTEFLPGLGFLVSLEKAKKTYSACALVIFWCSSFWW